MSSRDKSPQQIDAASNATLSADEALLRVRVGVTLVVLGVPQGSIISLDLRTYTIGAKFKGFKALSPDRVHLITFSPATKAGEGPITGTTGVFFKGEKGDVLVTEYYRSSECINGVARAPSNIARDVRLLRLDEELTFCSKAADAAWAPLVACVDSYTFQQAGVKLGMLVSGTAHNLVSIDDNSSGASSSGEVLPQGIPFTSIDVHSHPKGMSASEITNFHMDRTTLVKNTIESHYKNKWEHLIGELQLAFLTFLLLTSLEGLEHWKKLVSLLTQCDDLVTENKQLFIRFLATLTVQIQVIPKEVFIDEQQRSNFLFVSLTHFYEILGEHREDEVGEELRKSSETLSELVKRKYGWILPKIGPSASDYISTRLIDSFREDGPAIVPFEEIQRAIGVD